MINPKHPFLQDDLDRVCHARKVDSNSLVTLRRNTCMVSVGQCQLAEEDLQR